MRKHQFGLILSASAFFCTFSQWAQAKDPKPLTPKPLKSPLTLIEQRKDALLEQKLPDICKEKAAEIKQVEDLRNKLAELRPGAAEIPEITSKTIKQSSELKKDLARRAREETKQSCDDNVCAERILNACKQGAKLQTRTDARASATISPAPGVSWLQGVAGPGIAQFLTARADAELTLWLITAFQGEICSDSSESAKWFSATCTLASTLKQDEQQQISGSLMASALRKDLESFPIRIAQSKFAIDDESADALTSIIRQLREGESPLGLLAGLSEHEPVSNACNLHKTFACDLSKLGLAVCLTGDAASAQSNQFDVQVEAMTEALVSYTSNYCGSNCQGIELDKAKAKALLQASFNASNYLSRYSTATNSDGIATQKAGEIAGLTINIIDASVGTLKNSSPFKQHWPIIRRAIRASAVMMRGEYIDGTSEALAMANDLQIRLPSSVIRYAPFIVDMASAKTPDEAQAALNAASAPVGSWRIKRRAATFSVTGLIGGSIGYETPSGLSNSNSYVASGIMATLGVDFSIPIKTWTIGPYVSLIDVGQLVSTPIDPETTTSENTKSKPEAGGSIKAVQIFSPGAYLRIGVGNSPFTFGAGAAIAPQLRQFRQEQIADGTTTSERRSLTVIRAQAFVAIDLTIFPF